MRRLLACAVSAIAIAGCDRSADPLGPEASLAERSVSISDARHPSGNPHFYFLPPLAPALTYGGTFDPTLAPVVIICEWSGTACVGEPIATFSTESGGGSERVRVEPADEQYIVNWHTGRYPVADGRTYRIRVLVGSSELGFADVALDNSKGKKNGTGSESVAMKAGATLPIKFRIEQGALQTPIRASQPIAVGESHTCGIVQSGAAYCWGRNESGQLGDATTTPSSTPVPVAGGHTFTQIVAGSRHTCALDPSGAAYCWGGGALGRPTSTGAESVPGSVAGGHTFTWLTAGAGHTCGLDEEGAVWCWGNGGTQQLGDGLQRGIGVGSATPVQALGGPYKHVDAGWQSTCAVTTAGVGKCWGGNFFGNLGHITKTPDLGPGDYGLISFFPAEVEGGGIHSPRSR